jgi:hypothetical protein
MLRIILRILAVVNAKPRRGLTPDKSDRLNFSGHESWAIVLPQILAR